MAMDFTSTITDFDQQQFDSLDRAAGFASSYSRLRQKEADPRWVSRYLGWFDDCLLKAAIPVYRPRMKSWPDMAYDPRSWNLPDGAGDECSPEASLMVGGCSDRRTGLHADAEARTPGQLRRLLVELARAAADEDRCLVFPYMYTDARDALALATDDRIAWAELGREAHVFGLSDPQWESRLPSKVRNTLRRDQRKIAAVPMTVGEASWNEVHSWAAELISSHMAGKGNQEITEFVSLRYSDMESNPDVGLMAFTAQSAGLRGVQTILLWQGEMEVYEVGLTGDDSDERFALYVNLLFHLPFRYAQARGIDHIRLGSKSETPKAARGAVFENYYGGVLGLDETKRLALDSKVDAWNR
ncbi:hypothetical protein [Streptomyces sp. NPDC094468]|uniref:hypothetical protein n=1 Tax=Streptomyces sp. NPDC094468 TaxID=3366066 RepID=UPI0038221A61